MNLHSCMCINVYIWKACKTGTYGENCTDICGDCFGEDNCNHVTGICTKGCAAGYKGEHCKESMFKCLKDTMYKN